MRADDEASVVAAESLYEKLREAGVDVLYDDRDERGGVKLGSMDVIGLPWQFIVGPKSVAQGMIETKYRRTGATELIPVDRAVEVISTMGFAGYFLIVADFIKWAKANDIPVGPGRGSGAGSAVAWASSASPPSCRGRLTITKRTRSRR